MGAASNVIYARVAESADALRTILMLSRRLVKVLFFIGVDFGLGFFYVREAEQIHETKGDILRKDMVRLLKMTFTRLAFM
jgi:hypothetical protein